MYYVYILVCVDGSTYIGCTRDLIRRIDRHKKGFVKATENRRPLRLVCYLAFSSKFYAFNFKKYLKSGSGRAFMRKHGFVSHE